MLDQLNFHQQAGKLSLRKSRNLLNCFCSFSVDFQNKKKLEMRHVKYIAINLQWKIYLSRNHNSLIYCIFSPGSRDLGNWIHKSEGYLMSMESEWRKWLFHNWVYILRDHNMYVCHIHGLPSSLCSPATAKMYTFPLHPNPILPLCIVRSRRC